MSRTSRRGFSISVLLGAALGTVVFSILARSEADFNPEDAGLGLNTITCKAQYDGEPISGLSRDVDVVTRTAGKFQRQGRPIALWLGASQLHAINKYQPGDQLAVYRANECAASRGSRLAYLQISTPNAGLHDLLGFYLSFRRHEIAPDWLIVAVTYDDLREDSVRKSAFAGLPEDGTALIERGGPGLADLYAERSRQAQEASSSPVERNATKGTPQEDLELFLVRQLAAHWDAYRYRANLLAATQVRLRSRIAMLTGSFMARRGAAIPQVTQAWNQQALHSLIALTKAHGVKLMLYKPPHRPGEAVFYHDRHAYDEYFDRLRDLCDREGVYYADFQQLVPQVYWGLTNEGRPDVFHFQDFGHRRLGSAVDGFIAGLPD